MKPLDLSLYLVLDPDMAGGVDPAVNLATVAIASGVTCLQLRAPAWKKRKLLTLAERLLPICRHAAVPLIINDHLDVAMACHADGVHLGQSDLPVALAREWLGNEAIIGLSVSNRQQLADSAVQGANYLGVGPVFATATKPDADPAIGLDRFAALMQSKPLPVVAIGGITPDTTRDVIRAGADGIAVVSAICQSAHPDTQCKLFREAIATGRYR